MKQKVGLNRKVFDKNKFEKTIDNSFEEIIPPTDDIPTPEPTIGQFFQDYRSSARTTAGTAHSTGRWRTVSSSRRTCASCASSAAH